MVVGVTWQEIVGSKYGRCSEMLALLAKSGSGARLVEYKQEKTDDTTATTRRTSALHNNKVR